MNKNIEELFQGLEVWEQALAEDGHFDGDHRITISEAFSSPDAPMLFPKVLSRALKEAAEPQYLVTPLLSTVRIGKGRSLEFPAVNAIQAHEIPEGQEYPEQALAFAKQVEGKVSKKGVKVAFTEEVIADSLWDIVGLHVRAAGRAMARLKESIALKKFREAATVRFDNDDADFDNTTGLGADGAANGSATWDDMIDLASELIAQNHIPTDFILHPLMWAVFLKDAHYHFGGAGEAPAWNWRPGNPTQNLQGTAPLGLNVLVSPFVSFTAKTDTDPAKSDIFMIDRNEIGSLLVRDDLSTDDWTDLTRDIRSLKMKERYDIVMLGDGEGVATMANVSLARNHEIELSRTVA